MSAGHPGLPTRVVSAGLEGGHICYEWDLGGGPADTDEASPSRRKVSPGTGEGKGNKGIIPAEPVCPHKLGGVCGFLCHIQGSLSHVWTGATECLLDCPFQDKTCLQFPQYQVLMTRGEQATGRVLL